MPNLYDFLFILGWVMTGILAMENYRYRQVIKEVRNASLDLSKVLKEIEEQNAV